ncbi:MAG: hypothetical protein WKG32_23785 [Gemmatimonadaceae bacterium]
MSAASLAERAAATSPATAAPGLATPELAAPELAAPDRRRRVARAHVLMLALLLGAGIIGIGWGERIPQSGGLGWDGQLYGELARYFFGSVFVDRIDGYHIQRVLPSLLVHVPLRLLGVTRDTPRVILGFEILNLLLTLGTGVLWWRTANELGVSERGRWLGFTGLFVNFAMLKFASYDPVITDVSAFATGALMLWLFLRRYQMALLATALAGAFAWPLAGVVGALLLLFPRDAVPPPLPERPTALATALATGVAALSLAGFILVYVVQGTREIGYGPVIPVQAAVVPLSLALLVAYEVAAVRTLFAGVDLAYVRAALRSIRRRPLVLSSVALIGPIAVGRVLARDDDMLARATGGLAKSLAILPVTRPLIFFISHVVYFGPVLLLLLWCWPSVCRLVRGYGPGLVLVVLGSLILGLSPESRQSTLAVPIVMPFLVKAVDGLRWPTSVYWLLGGTALVASKVWLPIHPDPAAVPLSLELNEMLPYYARYFINNGTQMPNDAYLIQAACALALVLGIYALTRRGGRPAPAVEAS